MTDEHIVQDMIILPFFLTELEYKEKKIDLNILKSISIKIKCVALKMYYKTFKFSRFKDLFESGRTSHQEWCAKQSPQPLEMILNS